MIFPEDDHMIEALAPDTTEESLADRIQIRGLRRDVDDVDARARRDRGEAQ